MSLGPPDAAVGGVNILKFLALGRLAKGSSGGAVAATKPTYGPKGEIIQPPTPSDKHQVLAYAAATKDEKVKAYKKHVKAIMLKGAAKLTGGKRVRLVSQDKDYELHVLAEYVDNDPNKCIVFFVITDIDFGKRHSVANLLKEFKAGVFQQFKPDTLGSATSSSGLNRTCQTFFNLLFARYNVDKLALVSAKVESVKETMKDNVDKALSNVEQLEEMEVKAERMEDQARLFQKRSSNLLWIMRCRYIKIMLLIFLLVGAVLGYIIYYLYNKYHTNDSSPNTVYSSTGAGPR